VNDGAGRGDVRRRRDGDRREHDIGSGIKVADVTVADDTLGSASLRLSGRMPPFSSCAAARSTSSVRARTFEAKSSYAVTVEADGPSVGGAVDASAIFTLSINDVNEAPTAVSFANTIAAIDENTASRHRHQGRRRGVSTMTRSAARR
jgi:hypothetical protein